MTSFTEEQRRFLRDLKGSIEYLTARMDALSVLMDKLRADQGALIRRLDGTHIPNLERRRTW